MTLEEFAQRFGDFLSGTDEGRPITDDELELLLEVEHLAESQSGQAWMRQIIRGLPEVLYSRRLSAEEVAQNLMVPPAWIIRMAEDGVLHGTLGPDGLWRFSLSGVYAHVYPDEGLEG